MTIKYCLLIVLIIAHHASGFSTDLPDSEDWGAEWEDETSTLVSGFVDLARGTYLYSGRPKGLSLPLEEARVRLDFSASYDRFSLEVENDFLFDGVSSKNELELRKAAITANVGNLLNIESSFLGVNLNDLDLKLGRQIVSWGMGEYVFLNDPFPKDWRSLLAGRDTEYTKVPIDGLRVNYYGSLVNIDTLLVPAYKSDVFINGKRFSYFDRTRGEIVTDPLCCSIAEPSGSASNWEYGARLYKNIKGFEAALYLYKGMYRQPVGYNLEVNQLFFPSLNSYGASVRGGIGPVIAYSEFSVYNPSYDSSDERALTGLEEGSVVLPYSQSRFLLGSEWEWKADLTIGLQYYLEYNRHYISQAEPVGFNGKERHSVSLKLAHRALQQRLTTMLFLMLSPDDQDSFFILKAKYRITDSLHTEFGLNTFYGKNSSSFYGQFMYNSNASFRLRYSY